MYTHAMYAPDLARQVNQQHERGCECIGPQNLGDLADVALIQYLISALDDPDDEGCVHL